MEMLSLLQLVVLFGLGTPHNAPTSPPPHFYSRLTFKYLMTTSPFFLLSYLFRDVDYLPGDGAPAEGLHRPEQDEHIEPHNA
jgi:hypothetical protein